MVDKSNHYILTRSELESIAPLLGSGWLMVGRRLGLHESELENIQHDYRDSQLEQGYQMLLNWSRQSSARVQSEEKVSSLRMNLSTTLRSQGIRIKLN